jgi:hypothetical protein
VLYLPGSPPARGLLRLPHVQFWETENSGRLDRSHRGSHRRDIPCLVDASDVRTLNAFKTPPAWSTRRDITSTGGHNPPFPHTQQRRERNKPCRRGKKSQDEQRCGNVKRSVVKPKPEDAGNCGCGPQQKSDKDNKHPQERPAGQTAIKCQTQEPPPSQNDGNDQQKVHRGCESQQVGNWAIGMVMEYAGPFNSLSRMSEA